MPNIRVVSQVKKTSPTLDIVIDLEETVNPLQNSNDSKKFVGKGTSSKPSDKLTPGGYAGQGCVKQVDDEVDDDSDEELGKLRVQPLDQTADQALKAFSTSDQTQNMHTGYGH